jgi:PAS domain-containing protein
MGCVDNEPKGKNVKSVRSPRLVTAAIRDVSVRKVADTHFAQMEGRDRGLLDAAPDAMVVVNSGGDIGLDAEKSVRQYSYLYAGAQ